MTRASNLAVITLAALIHVVGVNGRGTPVMRPMAHVDELKYGDNFGWVAVTTGTGGHRETMRISDKEAERVARYLAGLEVKPTSDAEIMQWVRTRSKRKDLPKRAQKIQYREDGAYIINTDNPPPPRKKGPPAVYNPKE